MVSSFGVSDCNFVLVFRLRLGAKGHTHLPLLGAITETITFGKEHKSRNSSICPSNILQSAVTSPLLKSITLLHTLVSDHPNCSVTLLTCLLLLP